MQSYSVKDTIARLTQLSKQRKFSDSEKMEIASLYPQVTQFLFFERKGCNDCYKDA
jgi:protein-arginine kinase activator protein McsA